MTIPKHFPTPKSLVTVFNAGGPKFGHAPLGWQDFWENRASQHEHVLLHNVGGHYMVPMQYQQLTRAIVINKLLFHAILTLAHLAGSWCFGAEWPLAGEKIIDIRFGAKEKQTETLTLPVVVGGSIQGLGDGQPQNKAHTGLMSVVDAPGLKTGMVFNGAYFDVKKFTYVGDGTGTAFHINRLDKLSTGHHSFNNITLKDWNVGFQFGSDLDTNNCNGVKSNVIRFENCRTAVLTKNTMGMRNPFRDVHLAGCRNGFVFEAGGKASFRDVFVSDAKPTTKDDPAGALLCLVGTGKFNNKGQRVELGIGNNNNTFTFERVFMDSSVGADMLLVDMKNHFTHPPYISIEKGQISYSDYWLPGTPVETARPMMILRNPYVLDLSKLKGALQTGTIFAHHDPAREPGIIILGNAQIEGADADGDGDVDASDLINPTTSGYGKVNLTARNLYTPKGKTVPHTYEVE